MNQELLKIVSDAIIDLHVLGRPIVEAYHTDVARDVQGLMLGYIDPTQPFLYVCRQYGTNILDLKESTWIKEHLRREGRNYRIYEWISIERKFILLEERVKNDDN